MAEKSNRSAVVRELIQRSREKDAKSEVILQPPDEDDYTEPEDAEYTVEETVTSVLPAAEKVPVLDDELEDDMDDTEDDTLASSILKRINVLAPGVMHRAVADAMLTDLDEVFQFLKGWYATAPTFTTYAEAEDAVFQALINTFEDMDRERMLAHAIASWFALTLGLVVIED